VDPIDYASAGVARWGAERGREFWHDYRVLHDYSLSTIFLINIVFIFPASEHSSTREHFRFHFFDHISLQISTGLWEARKLGRKGVARRISLATNGDVNERGAASDHSAFIS
jgi:hypothetical protein